MTGLYDLTLKWMPEPIPSALGLPQAPLPPADPNVPDIFTALQSSSG